MRKLAEMLLCFAAILAPVLLAPPASAQATRTWVSGVGDDANPCSRTAPCKTFAGSISKTAAGGEINCLDPGGFGALTITKSITISCETGTAGVLVAGTNGFVVNAAATDVGRCFHACGHRSIVQQAVRHSLPPQVQRHGARCVR